MHGMHQALTFLLPINFLEKTLRDWKVTFEPMAAKKPGQLKVASDADAATTPPTIGTRDSRTGMLGVSPKKRLDSSTEKKGSMDYCITQVSRNLINFCIAINVIYVLPTFAPIKDLKLTVTPIVNGMLLTQKAAILVTHHRRCKI